MKSFSARVPVILCWCGCLLLPVSCKKSESAEAPATTQTAANPEPNNGTKAQSGRMPRESYDNVLLADDQNAIVEALAALAKSDPSGALAFIDKALASKHSLFIDYELLDPLLEMCRAGNSRMVLEWLAKHPKQTGMGELADLFQWIVHDDVELAISMAPSFSSEARCRILSYSYSWLAKQDYEAAKRRAKALPSEEQLGPLYGIAVAALVAHNFEDAFEISRGLNNTSRERSDWLAEIMAGWLRVDKIRGLDALKKVDSRDAASLLANPSFQKILMMNMEATDALGILQKVPLTAATQSTYQSFLNQVAERAPQAVFSELRKLPPSPAHNNLLRGVLAKVASQDLALAIQQTTQLSGGEQTMALRGVALSLAIEKPERALEVAAGALPGPQQQEVYREIARASASQKPENAVKILEDPAMLEKLGADFRQKMLHETVRTWADRNLEAAQHWVEQLPASDAPNAVQGLMTTWMKSDPVAASGWLSNQSTGPAREAGVRVVIDQIKDTDPEMAEQWRKTLAGEK
jgi:hypothetical protein